SRPGLRMRKARGRREKTAIAGLLSAAGPEGDHLHRLDEDEHVAQEGPFADIAAVELHALVVVDIAAAAHLPEAGNAGTNGSIMVNLVGIADHLVLHDRTRPDKAHVATDDVDELGQFVEAGDAQEAPKPRDARVVAQFLGGL